MESSRVGNTADLGARLRPFRPWLALIFDTKMAYIALDAFQLRQKISIFDNVKSRFITYAWFLSIAFELGCSAPRTGQSKLTSTRLGAYGSLGIRVLVLVLINHSCDRKAL